MKPNPFTAFLVVLSAAMLCSSAAAQTLEVTLENANQSVAEPAESRPLSRVTTAFAAGDRIGVIQAGPDCVSGTAREWSELLQRRVETDLPEIFREEMAKVVSIGTPGTPGHVAVNALVKDLNLRVCDIGKGAWRGAFHVRVSWQVISADAARVIYQATTDGSFARDQAQSSVSAASGLREAFAVAVRNLLADRRFASALRGRDGQSRTVAAGARY